MHTFQPYPAELFEFNPFTRFGNDWALLSAGDKDKTNALTVKCGGVGVLWDKNVCFVFVKESKYTKELLDSGDNFSLTFFDPSMKKSVLKYMGMVSGRDEDKIKAAGLSVDYSEDEIPYIDSGNLVFLCKKMSATPIPPETILRDGILDEFYDDQDYHTLYIGEIVQILAR
ncbi:MAG: flavin reductase [Lachnospiraceae bacterium]|nr:flavin reductase [Lachnospiraceae bacterium]